MLTETSENKAQSEQLARNQVKRHQRRCVGVSVLILCVIGAALIFLDQTRTSSDVFPLTKESSQVANESQFNSERDGNRRSLALKSDHETTLGNGWGKKELDELHSACQKLVRLKCLTKKKEKHCQYYDGMEYMPSESSLLLKEDNGDDDDDDDDEEDCVDINQDGRCDYSAANVEGCHNSCWSEMKDEAGGSTKMGAFLEDQGNGKTKCYCVLGTIGACCQQGKTCSGTSTATGNNMY